LRQKKPGSICFGSLLANGWNLMIRAGSGAFSGSSQELS